MNGHASAGSGRDFCDWATVNRNVKTVLAVSAIFGMTAGIYDFILPYYLKERGLSFESMGLIFAIAAGGMLGLRVVMGNLADRWGRKLFYGMSLAGTAVAIGLTPISGSVLAQGVLKTMREAMSLTRDTLHPMILYEESRGQFMKLMGKTRGWEFMFQAVGTVISGLTLARLHTGGNLLLAAGMTAVGFLVFWSLFREGWMPHQKLAKTTLRTLTSFTIHRNLKIITISVFIFNVGLTTSHCFIMPLFFSEKFHVSRETVAWVMVGHRLTIAIPLLLVGTMTLRNLKGAYIVALILEGVIQASAALVPTFGWATGVWLLHDFLGAGVWIPVQNLIIQEYTRPESRALEVGKILAFGGIGTIIGPFLAGFLSQRVNISAPYFVSGIGMILCVVPLFWLKLDAGLGREEPPVPEQARAAQR
jgi:MFS family permease